MTAQQQEVSRTGLPPMAARGGKKPAYRTGVFWIIIVASLAIVVGAWASLRSNVKDPEMAAPSHIGSLRLASLVTGNAAVQQMQQMHLGNIGVSDGYVATYRSGAETMTLWVGMSASTLDAPALLERMVEAIDKGGSPFSTPVPITLAGRPMYSTSGAGGQNYFFVEGRTVVWALMTGSAAPANRMSDILNTVKFE